MTRQGWMQVLHLVVPRVLTHHQVCLMVQGVSLEETEAHVTALIDALKGRKGSAFQHIMGEAQQQPRGQEGQTPQQQEQGKT